MSDTPWTDNYAQQVAVQSSYVRMLDMMTDHARDLERKLDKAAAEIERLELELDAVKGYIDIFARGHTEAERQRDEAVEGRDSLKADLVEYERLAESAIRERDEAIARIAGFQHGEAAALGFMAIEKKRADEAIDALRELLRVAEMDEPRFNEYHDACAEAARVLNQKEGT